MKDIPKKIRILRFVIEQGVVTLDDIRCFLGNQDRKDSIRVTLYKLGASHVKYGKISHGVWYINNAGSLELIKTYYPDLTQIVIRKVYLHHIPHALGINRIRIILCQNLKVDIDTWWSENYIRSLSPRQRFGISFTKIPDAIFWRLRSDGSRQKFFLEYERTLKSKSRYTEIFQYYANRKDVTKRNVLYICADEIIKDELEKIEKFLVKSAKLESAGLYFQFITFKSLVHQYLFQSKKRRN